MILPVLTRTIRMSLRARPVESVQRKRPFGVNAPPVGKFPSLVSLPIGSSCRPVGWIRVFGPTVLSPPLAAQASPAQAASAIAASGIHAERPLIRGDSPTRYHAARLLGMILAMLEEGA